VNPDARAGQPGLPLTHEHARTIEARLAALRAPLAERALSDGTFCNLHLFREAHAYRYLPGPWPVIAGRTYDDAEILIPLFDIAAAPLEVLRELQGTQAWFYPLAEEVIARLDPTRFEHHALRDDADYLYPATAFAGYEGRGLGPKRHAVARLLASRDIKVSPLGRENGAAAQEVLEGWCADKGRGPDEADCPACREALAELLLGGPLAGFLHMADGAPAGFVIVETLNPGVLAVRFAKGRAQYDGIVAYLFQDLVRRFMPQPRWLNFEQDLGKANFRRTKRSFRPVALLAKHRVRIRGA
jgi:hypothetical protein